MINIIETNSANSFDCFAFPEQNPANQAYFRNQVQSFANTLTDYGRQFMEVSKNIYETIYDSEAIRKARAALKFAKEAIHPNQIRELYTMTEFQTAMPIMQRYIMANVPIRTIYQDLKIDGYSDTYNDTEPGRIGVKHYDYRRVTDGMMMRTMDENNEVEFYVNNFAEELKPEDRDLDFIEKSMIMRIWDRIEHNLVEGAEDPTSPWGENIK